MICITENMKGILVALVILQLVLLSKGSLPKRPKSCPRNPKLEEWKEAVKQSLATKRGRGKRQSGVSKYLIVDKI
jgi:hypothetical protein